MNIKLLFLLLLPLLSIGQNQSLEDFFDSSESEAPHPLEEFTQYIQDPLDINHVAHGQLKQFYFIPEFLIDSLVSNRPFNSMIRVKKILGNDFFQLLQPYIYLSKKTKTSVRINSYFARNLDQSNPLFMGSMLSNKNTIRITHSEQLQAGFLTQKDPGERDVYDHWAGFISWRNARQHLRVTVGDFYLNHGQGLIASSPYLMRKSTTAMAPFRQPKNDLRPAISAQEDPIFRGLAAGYAPSDWLFIDTFYSRTPHDVTRLPVTTISTNGYHRTAQEDRYRDILCIEGIGGRLIIASDNLIQVGLCFITAWYHPHLQSFTGLAQRRDYFKFSGGQTKNISLFFSSRFNSFYVSGEIALSNNKYNAYQISAVIRQKSTQFALRFWHVSPAFHAPFSRYADEIRNSCGFYTALTHRLQKRLRLDSYMFIEQSIWRTYFNPFPVLKHEVMVRTSYRFASRTWLKMKFKCTDRQHYPATVKPMNVFRQVQYCIDLERIFANKFRIKTRLDYVFINDQGLKERGFNMFQDIRWQVLQTFTLHLRFGSFYTDSYNSRLYEYESDLPNVFSSFPLAGAGSKWYVYFIWKCIKEIELHVKYRQKQMNEDRRRDLGLCLVFKW